MIRRTLAAAALLAVALPAGAAECATAGIGWLGTTPQLVDPTGDGHVRYSIVGDFVNYAVGGGELASVHVPDGAVGVTVCPGGVTFALAAEPVDRPDTPQIADVSAERWNEYVDGADPEDVARYWAPAGVRPV